VAFVAFSTESPHASRGDVHLTDIARELRRAGIWSRVFHVQLDPRNNDENRRRVGALVERLVAERWQWAVFRELWTPELGEQLLAAGIRVAETRSHTFPRAVFAEGVDLLQHVRECATGQPIDELADLVEVLGPRHPRPITAIDLRINIACGYKRSTAENPFYRDVLAAPEVASHRGCAHCLSARPDVQGTPEVTARLLVERIRSDRQVFPAVETFWLGFAETFYDALAIAFRNGRDDPAWRGITLAMQCRPDVIAQRAAEIEALAADADACGTKLRIGVVGFENFSPREIEVLNRGAAPAALDAAARIVNRWLVHTPPGLVVRDFTPSFILFTPWTRVEDLEINLERIFAHDLWEANIERLRIGPSTPAFVKALHDGLIADGPVRSAAHPNGYSSEREIRFADPRVAAVCAGFERLRPLAFNEQAELLASVLDLVRAARDPSALDWDRIAGSWEAVGTAARGA
jgi:hypothetical protein